MSELKPCPFCGGEAVVQKSWGKVLIECDCNAEYGHGAYVVERTEAEAIEAWNSRAAMEFDNWFYLPKPKEPIVEVTETTHAWDGTKVKTDVFYQVQEQAVINWAKELDEHIIKRICEVWNSRAERTCKNKNKSGTSFWCSKCDAATSDGFADVGGKLARFNYCPNCGRKCI